MDLDQVKKRSISSFIFLSGRNALIQVIVFLGFFLLSRFLDPVEFGIYIVVSELVGILGYFSDIGLAAALIQKKKPPTITETRATFTLQQCLVFSSVSAFLVLGPLLSTKIASLSPLEKELLFAFIASFVLASLKTVPSVLLERRLKFETIALVDLVENILFYSVAVFFAARGAGTRSYVWAILVRSFVGVLLIYYLSDWKPGFSFKFKKVKNLFHFGIPYQLNSLIALLKDRLSTIFVWGIVGNYGISMVGWALRWSQAPLRFVMDVVMKITFPSFSRLQEDPDILSRAIQKSIFFISSFVFPSLVGLCLTVPDLISIVPAYGKWLPALLPLYFMSINSLIASITTPLTNAFNATGHIKITFRLMLFWTILTWIFFPILAKLFGYQGLAAAHALVALSSLLVWPLAGRLFKVQILKTVKWPILGSLSMAALLFLINRFFPLSLLQSLFPSNSFVFYLYLILKISLSVIFYSIIIYLTKKQELLWFKNTLFATLKKQS